MGWDGISVRYYTNKEQKDCWSGYGFKDLPTYLMRETSTSLLQEITSISPNSSVRKHLSNLLNSLKSWELVSILCIFNHFLYFAGWWIYAKKREGRQNSYWYLCKYIIFYDQEASNFSNEITLLRNGSGFRAQFLCPNRLFFKMYSILLMSLFRRTLLKRRNAIC